MSHTAIHKLSPHDVLHASRVLQEVRAEIQKVFYGHDDVVKALIRALLCEGHVLVEGVPGIAKTLVVKALAHVSGCSVKRVQFTVDLLPTDIVGLTMYKPHKGFEIVRGPIFTHFLIADEINRSPPKTQSALLEAMQERRVTIGKDTTPLPVPFFVMATQNPLETEGVYTLPEAQVDRFLYKVVFGYPLAHDELRVMEENVTFKKFEDFKLKSIISPEKIVSMQKMVHSIYLDEKIKRYILAIVQKTREHDFHSGDYIELGASPRASIALYISAKAEALLHGRNFVIPADVKAVATEVLRHRIILSYKAQAERVSPEMIIQSILGSVRAP